MKSLKGVLVNLWKSLRALSSFHTLMMLLTRARSFSCSTSRNWRVCLTIQEETKNQFKRDETTIINITGRRWLEMSYLTSCLYSAILCWVTWLRASPLCSSSILWIVFLKLFNYTHTHTHTHTNIQNESEEQEAWFSWHSSRLPYQSGVVWGSCAVWSGADRTAGRDGLSARVHGWREDDGRRWGRIHLHPAGSLPGGCPFQLYRGSHAWSSEPAAEQTTVETRCHYANIQLLCIIRFQKKHTK